ncbi:hypothetical protein HK102_008179 [Quaeritorhiza haematococci]|nr:hypothetical protein HK102_008179 [Quaeritorhiza haematococci]
MGSNVMTKAGSSEVYADLESHLTFVVHPSMDGLKCGTGTGSVASVRAEKKSEKPQIENLSESEATPCATPQGWRLRLAAVFGSNLFVFLAVLLNIFKTSMIVGLLSPVFPQMIKSIGFRDDAVLIWWNTLAYALQSVGFFLAALALGYLSDRYIQQRGLMLQVFSILFGGAMVVFVLVESAVAYMIVNIVFGMSQAASFVVGYAIVAGAFPPEQHSRRISIVVFAYTGGKMVGQIVGGIMADAVSLKSLLFLTIGISALDFLGTSLMKPSVPPLSAKEDRGSSIKEIARVIPLYVVGVAYFLVHITLMGFDSIYAIHLDTQFGMSPSKIGWFSMCYMVPFSVASPLTGILADKFPKYFVISFGLVLHAVSAGLIFLAPTEVTIAIAIAVFGASFVVSTVPFYPLMVSIAARTGLRNVMGQLSSLDGIIAGLGQIVGPLLIGAVKDRVIFSGIVAAVIFVYVPVYIVLLRRTFRAPMKVFEMSQSESQSHSPPAPSLC